MGHIERRQKEKDNIRKSIMEAALDIAISDGWNAVTIRKIANAIEYTPPIVYEHFKNKDDLFDELVLMGFYILHKEYYLARKTETDLKKILLQLSVSHWKFAFEHKELYQLMFSFRVPMPNEEIRKIGDSIENLFFELTNNRELAKDLMFNWMCLLNGYIFNTMQMQSPPELTNISSKNLFTNAIERFLKNI
jgi:AcrR family transcriptional regulator